jgi:hypothetical protein
MDRIDFFSLVMKMEKRFHVSVHDGIWHRWDFYLPSLTVKQFIDDWNNIVL